MKTKNIILCILVAVGFSSCLSTSNLMTKPCNEGYCDKYYDAIIIPGFPYNESSDNELIRKRVFWSSYLYHNGVTKNLIYSGSSVYSPYIEGEIMALYALEFGIPESRIFIEPEAEYSVENLFYALQIAKKQGFLYMAVATDADQADKMQGFIDKYGLDIDVIPFDEKIITYMPPNDIEIKNEKAYISEFESIIERKSLIERFKGTTGYNIEFSLKE